MVAEGVPADAILTSVLEKSGYLRELHDSTDPQDETRLENLRELITVAREFVSGVAGAAAAAVIAGRLASTRLGVLAELDAVLDPEADLAAGRAEPDPSLGAFLERVALVADSDQIPATPDGPDAGVVTLMTLHTAKGLEFDTVFLTGLEDGVFPHQRSLAAPDGRSWPRSAGWPTSASPGPGSGSTSPGPWSARPGGRRSTTRPAGSWTRCRTI